MSGVHSGSLSARRPVPESVSFFGFLGRLVGVLLWSSARPESLPVPLPGAEAPEAAGAAPRGVAGILAAVLAVLALAALAVGATAFLSTRSVVEGFIRTPPGTPLAVTASRLEGSLAGKWWSALYPGFAGRLDRAAVEVRQGSADLAGLAEAYASSRSAVDGLGFPARLYRGQALVAPLIRRLDGLRSPWHRGTRAYQEMAAAVLPYRDTSTSPLTRVRATLAQAPPDHGLLVTVTTGSGAVLAVSPPLEVGKTFEIPLEEDAVLNLVALSRPAPGAAFEVEEKTSLALTAWPAGGILFPEKGLAYAFRFDPEAVARAPLLPELSPSARTEIAEPAGGASR